VVASGESEFVVPAGDVAGAVSMAVRAAGEGEAGAQVVAVEYLGEFLPE